MALDTDSSLAALIAMVAWTMTHVILTLGYRSLLINTGRAKPNAFGPSYMDDQRHFVGRVGHSHHNCVENLVLFAAVVLVHRNSSSSSSIDHLAWYYVYARVGQALSHWWSISEMAVTVRFLFFVTSLVLVGRMLYLTAFL